MPAAVPVPAPAGDPGGLRNGAAELPRPRAHRDRDHRPQRQPVALHLPRLPQTVHHRRDHARNATAHRPTRRRAPRHQHHHGRQRPSTPKKSPTATARSSPAGGRCGPARNTAPPATTNGQNCLGHFERRKVAVGDCGRSYATPCIHEHSCLSELILVQIEVRSVRDCNPSSRGRILVACDIRACRGRRAQSSRRRTTPPRRARSGGFQFQPAFEHRQPIGGCR